jgi:bifunctional ADP-heptose synthase (sugar kinase/adenylyltransferase)
MPSSSSGAEKKVVLVVGAFEKVDAETVRFLQQAEVYGTHLHVAVMRRAFLRRGWSQEADGVVEEADVVLLLRALQVVRRVTVASRDEGWAGLLASKPSVVIMQNVIPPSPPFP